MRGGEAVKILILMGSPRKQGNTAALLGLEDPDPAPPPAPAARLRRREDAPDPS